MKISSKYIFLAGLFFLSLDGISLILNHSGFALKIFSVAFWFIVGGVGFYILKMRNEK